jgi:hypothetical protein
MKKIISFSLYNNIPKYSNGIVCNIELAKILFPDWICRIYCGESVPDGLVNVLSSSSNTEVIPMKEDTSHSFMMWRFVAIDDEDVAVMISRDADSRLSKRESASVKSFLESDRLLHSIQDNVNHNDIMGGLWGMKKNDRVNMSDLISNSGRGHGYGVDQNFMRSEIAPLFKDSYLIHDTRKLNAMTGKTGNVAFFIGSIHDSGNNYGQPTNHIFY